MNAYEAGLHMGEEPEQVRAREQDREKSSRFGGKFGMFCWFLGGALYLFAVADIIRALPAKRGEAVK